MERLDKVLAHQGYGSRRDVKALCHQQIVFINGKLVTDPSAHIDIEKDILVVDGEEIRLQKDIFIMMNKCKDVVCANKDGEHQTVFDLLDQNLRHKFLGGELHCMGRLDIDTEGLLILTTDGKLTHRLLSPKVHVPKTYAVGLRDSLTADEKAEYIESFNKGFWIDRERNEEGFQCRPSQLVFIEENNQNLPELTAAAVKNSSGKADCYLTIYEGKFHQVKRMFAQKGNQVIYLKRVKMGALTLDSSIELGSYRELSKEEIDLLAGKISEEE